MSVKENKWKYEYVDLPDVSEETIEEYIEVCKKMFPRNKVRYKRTEQRKDFDTVFEKEEWELQEIDRCRNGYRGMCGKMYFYFNYCKITGNRGGKFLPEYRVCDEVWFRLVESCELGEDNEGKGVVCVKRRRAGFSWKEASDTTHDGLFNNDYIVGMDSKTELDSEELFKKVRHIYDNLPTFLRHPVEGGDTKSSIVFARKEKDDFGKRLTGNQSEVFCVAPTDSAYEGRRMNKWVSDEAGKKDNLMTMWALNSDCLDDEKGRAGIPIFFGTSGDVDKGSAGLKELWEKNDAYDMIKFFFPGWAGKNVDEFGNDNIEVEVRKILKTRRVKLENEANDYFDYVQKHPLTVREALQYRVTGGIGNIRNIKEQRDKLASRPAFRKKGVFRWGGQGEDNVVFEPSIGEITKESFFWLLYEDPQERMMYLSGADPVDHDDTNPDASSQAGTIMKRQNGSDPSRLVARIMGKPNRAYEFYEQYLMGLLYYNNARTLIESNRNGMIRYFENNGYKHLLKEEPLPKNKVVHKYIPRIGGRKGAGTDLEFRRLCKDYTDNCCDLILDIDVLDQLLMYGDRNTDLAVAFLWNLVHLDDVNTIDRKNYETEQRPSVPKFRLVKVGGVIKRVTDKR